ncbi:hypothetical protein G6F32_017260 [Rhizopus arrhizus]|nr:hypothetical protein G6F32_017260 [Rhizopus arrhizus]
MDRSKLNGAWFMNTGASPKPKLPSIGLAAAGAASAGAAVPAAGSAGRSQAARDRLAMMASARVGRRRLDMDLSCSGNPQV